MDNALGFKTPDEGSPRIVEARNNGGVVRQHEDYQLKYERLKEFVRGKWKGDCAECAAIANSVLNKEFNDSMDE